MITISLSNLIGNTHNFLISTKNRGYTTSGSIANLLNLDVDTYNDRLIREVIQHPCFKNVFAANFPFLKAKLDRNIVFYLNDVPKETYIERFKEVFVEQLTLLELGGIIND